MKSLKQFIFEAMSYREVMDAVYSMFVGISGQVKHYTRIDGNTISFEIGRGRYNRRESSKRVILTFDVYHSSFKVVGEDGTVYIDPKITKDPLQELYYLIWGIN